MRRSVGALVVASLMAAVFSGCFGGGPEVAVEPPPPQVAECVSEKLCTDAVLDNAGRDLRTDLTAEDRVEVPRWKVGDAFEQHLFYGSKDTVGEHITTMVVDDSGPCYMVATSSELAARNEAAFDLPILGCVGKYELKTTGFRADWSWMYQFPLYDGKTWPGRISQLFNWNQNEFQSYEFTLTATYKPSIDAYVGDFPGFLITGMTADGQKLIEYDYTPAVGWFAHFYLWDLSTPDPDDFMFHAMSMGTSKDWKGSYYIDTAKTLAEASVVAPFVDARWRPFFMVGPEVTYVMGMVVPLACAGTSRVVLIPPNNQPRMYEHTTTDPTTCLDGGGFGNRVYTVHFLDEPAQAGQWRHAVVGAGVVAGYFLWVSGVTQYAYELT